MTLYAIDDLGDAWRATREFLTPPSAKRWLALAVIVFFVAGSGTASPTGIWNVGTDPTAVDPDPAPDLEPVLDELVGWLLGNLGIVAGVLAAVLVVTLGIALLGALMEFVFVQSLRTGDVRLREYARRYLGKGVRLFGFRLALWAVTLLIVGGAIAGAVLALGVEPTLLVALAALALVGGAVLVVVSLVDSFTTEFVVAIMLVADCGVLGGWRRLWSALVAEWKQYLAYAVAAFLLKLVAGLLVSAAVGVLAVLVAIPFAVLGVGLFVASGGLGPVVLVGVGALVLAYAAVVLLILAIVLVPVESYLRYYALFVLGDTDADLDPIPERRAAVRAAVDEAPSA